MKKKVYGKENQELNISRGCYATRKFEYKVKVSFL